FGDYHGDPRRSGSRHSVPVGSRAGRPLDETAPPVVAPSPQSQVLAGVITGEGLGVFFPPALLSFHHSQIADIATINSVIATAASAACQIESARLTACTAEP